jgi:signal transduction histidine kinase
MTQHSTFQENPMPSAPNTNQSEPSTQLTDDLIGELSAVPLLASLSMDQFRCLEPLNIVHPEPGTFLAKVGEPARYFWILLEGEVEVVDVQADGREYAVYVHAKGAAFGEVPLLANIPNSANLRTRGTTRLLRFDENAFWSLMTACPEVRQAILRNMAMRLQKMQHYTVQQEKMAALGTLAAGLMHELNNPGAAARRASTQLRENFVRLQELSTRFNHRDMTDEQKICLQELKDQALHATATVHMSSLEQSDAEELLSTWLDQADIPNAWKLAPTLASVGVTAQEMECARHAFPADTFVDAITWIEALVSSTQLITTIEESIGRVTELVRSVKSYAYEGSGQLHSVDLNESIHAALVILGHKIREKQITLTKNFSSGLPSLRCACKGLNQIWTNLIDNAIDAVGPAGRITVETSLEVQPGGNFLCIAITDNGEGIRPDLQPRIFDPFFTTKEPGVGTGLGLGIVHRLVEQNMGTIRFASEPGKTEFLVRLPAEFAAPKAL